MSKKDVSLLLNMLIIIFETSSLMYSTIVNKSLSLEFYTIDSNILLLISSCIFVYYTLHNKKIPKWLHTLKYMTTTCVSITLLVVIFILTPMYGFNFYLTLFSGVLLFHHTVCPLLGIITFLKYDNLKIYNKKEVKNALSFTFIYAIILIILNILKVVKGPYPFLMVRSQSIIMSIIWFVVIIGFAYLIAIFLKNIHTNINKEVLSIYLEDGTKTNKTVLRGSDDDSFGKKEHFAVSVIFIENNNGEFLIQKLPNGKYSSTGGHVLKDEEPIDSIVREVYEEIGIKLNKKEIEYVGFKVMKKPIRFLYYIKKNVNINKVVVDKNEVSSVEYMTRDKIEDLIKNDKMKKSHAILYKDIIKYNNK